MRTEKAYELLNIDAETVPENKIKLLRLCQKWADKAEKIQLPKGRSIYRFTFDEGVFQGQTVIRINQNNFNALSVLNMINSVGWPGFSSRVNQANALLEELLFKELEDLPCANSN